jgi:phosphate starvation-inducible PhoH-like protein
MNEKIITLDSVEPVEIYGVNDVKLNIIKKYFPKLKLIARGYSLKVMGDSNEITRFEKKLELMVDHYHKSGILTDTVIWWKQKMTLPIVILFCLVITAW